MRAVESTTGVLAQCRAREVDDVAIRRLRKRILDDVASLGAPVVARMPRARTSATAPAMLVAIAAGLVLLWPSQRIAERNAPVASSAVIVTTNAFSKLNWSRRIVGGSEWVDLFEGTFHIEIREHAAGRRITVRVPDGRIDDVGTTFDVTIARGHTTRVLVEDGSVAVRIEGVSPVILAAGQGWERPRTMIGVEVSRPELRPSTARTTRARHRRELETGHKAEDESYLMIIRLLRESRGPEAQEAARDYLRNFPDGFRRAEVGALARSIYCCGHVKESATSGQ